MKTIEQLAKEISKAQVELRYLERERNKETQKKLREEYAGKVFKEREAGDLYLVIDGPYFDERISGTYFNKYLLPAVCIPGKALASPNYDAEINVEFTKYMEEIPYEVFREALYKRTDELLQIHSDPNKVSYRIGDEIYFEDYENF